MQVRKYAVLVLVTSLVFLFLPFLSIGSSVYAATTVDLLSADNFAVLGASTITNTGSSVITGDLGLWAGTSVTGFPPGTVSGTQHITDTTAQNAQTDLTTAYNDAAGRSCDQDLSGQDLGGKTLTPGTYCYSSSAQLTGTLTLDASHSAEVFIFKIGSILTTASSGQVSLVNSSQACNVFWQVGDSATLGTSTNFKGNILALNSITITTSAIVSGRVLARTAAVTLDTNTVTKATCAACVRDSDCNDANSCTTDVCSSGTCSNTNNPVDGVWTYSSWGTCSGTCGGGSGTRTRTTLSCSATCGGSCGTAVTSESCTNNDVCPSSTTTTSSTSTSTSTSAASDTSCSPLKEGIVTPQIIGSRRVGADSIYLNWGPDSGTDNFNVRYGLTSGVYSFNADVTGFSTTINGIPSNRPIWIQVAARNNCLIGSYGDQKLIGGTVRNRVPGLPDTGDTNASNSGAPRFPNTGFGPRGKIDLWYVITILVVCLHFFVSVKSKH